jgi:hypothetical protein
MMMAIQNESISIFCPYCHQHTALSVAPGITVNMHGNVIGSASEKSLCIWNKVHVIHGEKVRSDWWIGICNSCRNPVLVRNAADEVYPHQLPTPTDERIPEAIRRDLDEAKLCLSVGAYRACSVMARRTIQAACIHKGAPEDKKIYEQINYLFKEGIITVDVKDWAHSTRWVGNDAAHPSEIEVDESDAEDVLKLAEQFLYILFVTPAIAQQQRQKRGKE